ncbi:MAG TPA: SMI1/KNR4 family protein [Polyangiaceae bacterium]|jgi:hypothetical protein
MIDWEAAFDEAEPQSPLAKDALERELAQLSAPLDDAELKELTERVGNANALRTENPVAKNGFPADLLSFYRWADGGTFSVGDRHFDPLLAMQEIREYMISYGVIHFLPGCIPIGMDGGGCFYLLDLGARPEPTVYFGGMNELDSPDAVKPLALSLRDLFTDKRDPVRVTGL